MQKLINEELDQLRSRVQEFGARVEKALDMALSAFENADKPKAQTVIRDDSIIDAEEVEIEEKCLQILALHNPVASDLRYIVAVLKLNNDLERIGDICVSIARRARYLAKNDVEAKMPPSFERMKEITRYMLHHSLLALTTGDAEKARQICIMDDEVDKLKKSIMREIRHRIEETERDDIDALFKLLDVPRHLERIADAATNIAEDVVYMAEGDIMRHQLLEQSA